jgi:hypothetical protein
MLRAGLLFAQVAPCVWVSQCTLVVPLAVPLVAPVVVPLIITLVV